MCSRVLFTFAPQSTNRLSIRPAPFRLTNWRNRVTGGEGGSWGGRACRPVVQSKNVRKRVRGPTLNGFSGASTYAHTYAPKHGLARLCIWFVIMWYKVHQFASMCTYIIIHFVVNERRRRRKILHSTHICMRSSVVPNFITKGTLISIIWKTSYSGTSIQSFSVHIIQYCNIRRCILNK